LNRIQELDAFIHGFLERLAPGNQPHATRTLVDNSSFDGLGKIEKMKIQFPQNIVRVIEQSNKEKISSKIADVLKAKKEINSFNFLAFVFKNINPSDLVFISDMIKKELGSVFLFLVSESEDKNIFICSTSEDYAKRHIEANKFVPLFKEELSLKGGGRPTLVQGVLTEKKENLLSKVEDCFIKFIEKI